MSSASQSHATPSRIARGLLITGAAVALVAAGCSGAATPAPTVAPTVATASSAPSSGASGPGASGPAGSSVATNTVKVTAKDYSYDLPATIPAGPTTITLTNAGKEEHQAQIARLNDGVTPEKLQQALQNPDPSAALGMVTLAGGPNAVAPGATVSASTDLKAGNYIFLCMVAGPDNIPHIAKGMAAPVQVTGTATTSGVPTGETTVTAKDFSFDTSSASLTAGKHTFSFVNNGPQPHEAGLMKLPAGMTVDQLKQMMAAGPGGPNETGGPGTSGAPQASSGTSGPSGSGAPSDVPPFLPAGGIAGVSSGTRAAFEMELTAGNYAWVCFIPDPATGKAHAELGMIAPLTVK